MYSLSCMVAVIWPWTLASRQCRDGARRVFTDQAAIACTTLEAKREIFGDMTTDPRIPTMPGRSTSGFHRPSRHCSHQARKVFSESHMHGVRATSYEAPFARRTCALNDSVNESILFSGVATNLTSPSGGVVCSPITHVIVRYQLALTHLRTRAAARAPLTCSKSGSSLCLFEVCPLYSIPGTSSNTCRSPKIKNRDTTLVGNIRTV